MTTQPTSPSTSPSSRSEQIMQDLLDHLIQVQDALEAMRDTYGLTREQYISIHKDAAKERAAAGWNGAQIKLRRLGTVRKALNEVGKRIDWYRNFYISRKKGNSPWNCV